MIRKIAAPVMAVSVSASSGESHAALTEGVALASSVSKGISRGMITGAHQQPNRFRRDFGRGARGG